MDTSLIRGELGGIWEAGVARRGQSGFGGKSGLEVKVVPLSAIMQKFL